jgi:hypothetical protein
LSHARCQSVGPQSRPDSRKSRLYHRHSSCYLAVGRPRWRLHREDDPGHGRPSSGSTMSPLPRAPGSGSSRLAAGSPLLVVMFRARGRRASVGGSGSKREPWSAGHGTPLWPPPRHCAVVAAAAVPLWSGGHSDSPLRYADVAAAVPGPLRRCGHRYAAGHT